MHVTLEDKFVTLSGTAFGVHYDSSGAYPIDGAKVNVRKMNGPKDIGEVVASAVADENGEYSVEVPRDEDQLYAIEVLDDGHHEKVLKTNTNVNPTNYHHIFLGQDDTNRDPYLLSKAIDELYFYGVVKNDAMMSGGGGPLAKWDKTKVDSSTGERYAAPKTWVEPDTNMSDRIKEIAQQMPDTTQYPVHPEIVSDSSQADIKIFFVEQDHPILDGQGYATYRRHVNTQTNTLESAEIYFWKYLYGFADQVVEKAGWEELTQAGGTPASHDISVYPYNSEYFYGNDSPSSISRPGEYEIKHLFKTSDQLPKGW